MRCVFSSAQVSVGGRKSVRVAWKRRAKTLNRRFRAAGARSARDLNYYYITWYYRYDYYYVTRPRPFIPNDISFKTVFSLLRSVDATCPYRSSTRPPSPRICRCFFFSLGLPVNRRRFRRLIPDPVLVTGGRGRLVVVVL